VTEKRRKPSSSRLPPTRSGRPEAATPIRLVGKRPFRLLLPSACAVRRSCSLIFLCTALWSPACWMSWSSLAGRYPLWCERQAPAALCLREWSYRFNRRNPPDGLDQYVIRRAVECTTLTNDQGGRGAVTGGAVTHLLAAHPWGIRIIGRAAAHTDRPAHAASPQGVEFAPDSPLEEARFEPSVPVRKSGLRAVWPHPTGGCVLSVPAALIPAHRHSR
jgi:hypothetical protein